MPVAGTSSGMFEIGRWYPWVNRSEGGKTRVGARLRVVTFFLLVAVAFALSLSGTMPTAARAQEQVATATRVVDGDTIEVSPAVDGNDDVRLIGVDTPENAGGTREESSQMNGGHEPPSAPCRMRQDPP